MDCEEADVWPPGDGDVVVRTTYASICGSDLHAVFFGVDIPLVPCPHGFPGHEGIGEVVESHHSDFAVGDQCSNVNADAVFASHEFAKKLRLLPIRQPA